MKVNQFAVYQVKDGPAFREQRFCSYDDLKKKHLQVDAANYSQVYISPMSPRETATSLHGRLSKQLPRNFKGHSISVSDVYMLNRDGVATAYYADKNDKLIVLSGFLRRPSSGNVITMDTKGYKIGGMPGTWVACEETVVDGRTFYLMQSEKYRDNATSAILAGDGRVAIRQCTAIDAAAIAQTRLFLNPPSQEEPVKEVPAASEAPARQQSEENGQQSAEGETSSGADNGMEESDEESIEEQIRNLPPPRVMGRKVSVMDRLRLEQAELTIRSGKPVPRNIERMNEALSRK